VIAWGRVDPAPIPARRARRRSSSTSRTARRAPDSLLAGVRDEVLATCAVKKPMGVTYMRDTAAMWLKIEGVNLWISADRLGISAKAKAKACCS
jgi:hypothetical protein